MTTSHSTPATDAIAVIAGSGRLWTGGAIPSAAELPVIASTVFQVIKPYQFAEDGYRFHHGVALAWHKGTLYASIGMNRVAENTGGEEALCYVSGDDGASWQRAGAIDAGSPESDTAVSHGVFLSHAGALWAFHGAFVGLMNQVHTRAYRLDERSGRWEPRGTVIAGGFWPLQEPVPLPDGNWLMAGMAVRGDCAAGGIHPPAVAISRGDDLTCWELVVLPCRAPGQVWGESTVYLAGERLVNVARYGEQARALMAISDDGGRTWTEAAPANLPLSPSKPSAGTLSTGQHYLIGTIAADAGFGRTPLSLALTRPGEAGFSDLRVIRHAVFPAGPGESHPQAALAYPYAIEHAGKLYVGYSNSGGGAGRVGAGRETWNNNSIELAVIPVADLA
jgi:hypothetical protein